LDQFDKWRLHWFVYKKDTISWLTDQLNDNLYGNHDISYNHQWHIALVRQALRSKHRWEYCICGGWSNNLSKGCNSKLFSENGSIWVVDAVNDTVTFFSVPVFTGLVSQWTHIKDTDVILGDVKSIYRQQKNSN
jgi:hypothetical protein